jgi:hypothetical protein
MHPKSTESRENFVSDPEADGYSRGAPATGVRLVSWLILPPVSGLECAAALRRAGFGLGPKSQPGIAELTRDGELIRVPLAQRLAPQVLITILSKAGIGPARFLELLND